MEIIDETILQGFKDFEAILRADWRFFVYDAQALAAIFMIAYFGIKSYGLISGDDKWEIMPLLRPFALTLVIMLWIPFVSLIEVPFEVIEGRTQGLYLDQQAEINRLMELKSEKMTAYAQKLMEISSEVEASDGDEGMSIAGALGIDTQALINEIKALYLVVQAKLRYVLEQILLFIVLGIFQFCVYIVAFLQLFFKHILVVLGPLAFAFSIIPAFRDSYTTWIGRFISVCLYGTIARLILVIAFAFIKYSLDLEITQLEGIMCEDCDAEFLLFATVSGIGQVGFLVALLVGGVAMLTVPVISTWIVNTSGVGQAVGKVASGGMAVASGGASMASKVGQ